MQNVRPFLWFDNNVLEAVTFYTSVVKNSKIVSVDQVGESGSITIVRFEIDGLEVTAFNGGPGFPFTWSISLWVDCQTQDEVDRLWEELSEGGEKSQCGWLKDKFGLWWQIVPTALTQMLTDPDKAKAECVFNAMLKMSKIEIADLQQAYDG